MIEAARSVAGSIRATTFNLGPSLLKGDEMRSRNVCNGSTHCSRRKEWFHGPSGEPRISYQDCNPRRETSSQTEHDISSTDKKDIKSVVSWSEGCPVCERIDRRSPFSSTTAYQGTSAKITYLSIRTSFVGSIELFRDVVLVDPRLEAGPSPPRGVMWNEKDMVDELKGIRREEGDWRGCGEKRKEEKMVT